MDRVLVVTADAHIGATAEVYREYLEPALRADYDEIIQASKDTPNPFLAAGQRPGADDMAKGFADDYEDRSIFGTDPPARLKYLEREGVVAEVVFPDPIAGGPEVPFSRAPTGVFAGVEKLTDEWARRGPEKQLAGQKAYNRYLADRLVKDRQAGLAIVGWNDVAAAVGEIHAAAKAGLKGVLVYGADPDLPPLHDPYYEPIWSACADDDMPIHWHSGAGAQAMAKVAGKPTPGTATPPGVGRIEGKWFARRSLANMLGGGILARHPKLRIVYTELGCGWALPVVEALDWTWELAGGWAGMPEKPSEYFKRQVFFGASPLTVADVKGRELLGVGNLMWGTDHPHPGSAWGKTLLWARATFGQVQPAEADMRAIIGGNAARFYGFDVEKLEAVAARVGPTVDEVMRKDAEAELDPVVRRLATTPLTA